MRWKVTVNGRMCVVEGFRLTENRAKMEAIAHFVTVEAEPARLEDVNWLRSMGGEVIHVE